VQEEAALVALLLGEGLVLQPAMQAAGLAAWRLAESEGLAGLAALPLLAHLQVGGAAGVLGFTSTHQSAMWQ
jgi:hypothetical protein